VSIVEDPEDNDRSERLWSLGVTPGASITVLQTFPGVVFLCDQTELVVERSIARAIRVGSVEALS
jgi:Fe2+ transport system protein FeoA